MAKKKNSKGGKAQSAKKNAAPRSKTPWIVAAAVGVGLVALLALSTGNPRQDTGVAPSSQEAAYIGRFLPAGYQPAQVADRTLYTSAVYMTEVAATPVDGGVSVPLAVVADSKIVRFDYQRADGQVLPMLAYVKPSGKLFVGVSYCPPCEGEGQRIEADGTLTCESCGTRRDLETNAGLSGACKFYPLDEVPATVAGSEILVDGAILDSWTPQPLDRPVG